jgi:succinyl-diaminopimelate desuccinylase
LDVRAKSRRLSRRDPARSASGANGKATRRTLAPRTGLPSFASAATAMASPHEWLGERLFTLCRDDTTTGREDQGLPALHTLLREVGAEVREQQVAPGRTNVLATWSAPAAVEVLLSTHLDTVPPYVPPRREGDTVFGRGACDAKGQIVAQLAAIRTLLDGGERRIAWLGVVGEETDSIGAQMALHLAPDLGSLRAVIDGEPTDNVLATGQRGVTQLRLECVGKAAHSGTPEAGHSAILDLLAWLQHLRDTDGGSDPELGAEAFNIGVIRGGTAANVVPAHAEAQIMARTIPDSDFAARVRRTAPPTGNAVVLGATPPDRYPMIPGMPRATVPFGSDAPRLRRLAKGGMVALVGPGSIRVAHTESEHLHLGDLARGVQRLVDLTRYFLDS